MLSDLVVAPLTDDECCYEGLTGFKNTLNYIAKMLNKKYLK
jgi:cellulose biosynthesis protein BcsQ